MAISPQLQSRIDNFTGGGRGSFLPETQPVTPLSPTMDVGQSIDDISQSLSRFAPYGDGKTVDYMVTDSAQGPNESNQSLTVFREVVKQIGLPAENMEEAKAIFDYEARQNGLNFAASELMKRFGQMSQSENTLAQDPRDYRVSSMSEMASGTEPFSPESGNLYRGPQDAPTSQDLINRFEAEMAAKGRDTGQGSVATGADVLTQNFQEGGGVEQMMMEAEPDPEMMIQAGQNIALEEAINGLMSEQMQSEDPEEQEMFAIASENIMGVANAPMGQEAQMIAAEGRGEDTALAHLRPGEVVLPPEMFEDAQFESVVEDRFNQLELDPERYVVGVGIASLNPITGLEEFGFFKKAGKFLKKAAPYIATAATVFPGVGTAIGSALGGIGGLAAKIPVIGKTLGNIGSTVAGGIAGLGIPGISPIAGGALEGSSDFTGTLMGGLRNPLAGGIFGKLGSTYQGGPMAGKGLANRFGLGSGTQTQIASDAEARKAIETLDQMSDADKAINPEIVEMLEEKALGTVGRFEKTLSLGLGDSVVGGKGGLPGLMGMLGLGEKGDLGRLALGGGAAYMLGKLAMDEAKKDKGVPKVPLTMMDSGGRYNIAAEVARQRGMPAPNPVEFGMLPRGTFPTMSGGRRDGGRRPAVVSQYYDADMPQYDPRQIERPAPPIQVAGGGPIYGYEGGGEVPYYMGGGMVPMAYANGGNVAVEDFERMNGGINGPGTETSDDVPAMLSDGEFVMTGQAVRGAGSFDMNQGQDGILTLTPSGAPDRQRGTDVMYSIMNMFEGVA